MSLHHVTCMLNSRRVVDLFLILGAIRLSLTRFVKRLSEIGESAATQAAQKRPGLLGVYSSVSGISGAESASYTSTPEPAEGEHYATTATSKHNTGDQNITTTTTAVPSPPPAAMHHSQVHEMDPQREGPFELADMYSPVGHGPLRSYEEEEAAHAAALAVQRALKP